MKKTLLFLALAMGVASFASAKWDGDGYYRVQNYMTQRYLYVLDNEADINYTATTVDMNGVELWRGEDKMLSDAASVVYIKKVGNQYDILAQGTGIHAMSDVYLNLRYEESKDAYYAYGTAKGMTKYLGDSDRSPYDRAFLRDNASGDYRLWKVHPLTLTEHHYFGVAPTVKADGVNYATIYADFPFSPAEDGLEMYYVSKIDAANRVVVISPVADNMVARSTPVIIKCAGSKPENNKLNIGVGADKAPAGNLLSGVFFDNEGDAGHFKLTDYDPKTMRVLGLSKENDLAFIVDKNLEIIPRNTAFLKVPADCPQELRVVTEKEYVELGVCEIENEGAKSFDVYNVLGVKVQSGVTKVENLPAGIYIANGKKYVVR